MSGYYNQSDPDGFESRDSSGGGLRKQLEETLAEVKELRQQINGREREKSVAGLLKDKGLDPAVAELIPSDADPVKWLDDKGHLLGIKKQEAADQQAPVSEVQVAPDDDPALAIEREALAAIQGAAESGSQASIVNGDLIEQMNKVGSEEELIKFFKANGMA